MVIKDPVPFLHILVERVQIGFIATKGSPIQNLSVELYLCSMGKIFLAVGTTDPRLKTILGLDFRLGQQLKAYVSQDPPPTQVHPVPISIYYNVFT